MIQVLHGDCLSLLPTLPDNSIDAIVTDPPYCLDTIARRFGSPTAKPTSARQHKRTAGGFMGKTWDNDIAFKSDVWNECLRILKPGGYMVAFGGCRTYHRLVCAIEDAGFVIHPMLAWVFGSGFPKATNASKMIDKHLGAERALVGTNLNARESITGYKNDGRTTIHALSDDRITAPATPEAAQWEGWSYGLQSLKPALEPICMAQKPMIGSGAENILAWGVGAVNIDATRVPAPDADELAANWDRETKYDMRGGNYLGGKSGGIPCTSTGSPLGRWSPNLLLDGSPEVVECFPNSKSCDTPSRARPAGSILSGRRSQGAIYPGEKGSAARFFPSLGYSEDERRVFYQSKANKRDRAGSSHPTIKPIKLMEWLCKLICPPNGTILDPFAGSGTTGQAAANLGFDCILIEQSEEYVADIQRRMNQSDDLVTFTR